MISAGRIVLAGGCMSRDVYQRSENKLNKTHCDRKRDICTFDYSIRVMNKHAGSTLTRLVGKPFSPINAGKSCLGGKGCLGYLRPYNEGLSAIPPHPIQQLPLVPQGRAYIGKGGKI